MRAKLTLGLGVVVLSLACFVTPAATQQPRRYIRLSLGSTQLQSAGIGFPAPSSSQPTLMLGFALTENHSIGVAVSHLQAEATEVWGGPLAGETPYTLTVRAIPLEVRYKYRFSRHVGPVHPLATLGGLWVPVRDTWTSDTPTESSGASAYGINGSVGLLADVGSQAGIVFRGGYRAVTNPSDRPSQRIGLSGFWLDGGVELRF